jgi:hypothetical protein
MYIQLKDEKAQVFKPQVWTLMKFGRKNAVKCDLTSHGIWVAQLHLTLPKTGGPTWVKMQYSRDPHGANDTTGTTTHAISPDGPKSLQLTCLWFFGFEKNIEMGVRIRHNGKVNIKSPLRQFKALSIQEFRG